VVVLGDSGGLRLGNALAFRAFRGPVGQAEGRVRARGKRPVKPPLRLCPSGLNSTMYPIAVGRHLTIKRTAHTAISKGVRSMAGTVTRVERIAATRPVFEPWKRPYFAGYFSETRKRRFASDCVVEDLSWPPNVRWPEVQIRNDVSAVPSSRRAAPAVRGIGFAPQERGNSFLRRAWFARGLACNGAWN
jgi:hypothetical protein